ncbi:unnamed protein product [Soboliphyme baturini]|uniref:Phosphomevalonate kinase n=1 Tax=Soboliphyme baturini TaxID=241478 RepID=A0A183IU26_9BILA|nr:unnamed protein product [Soboliphyme baturini]
MSVQRTGHSLRVIVLVSGKRKCGKDFLSQTLKTLLEQRALSVCIVHLSAPLKRQYAELHGLDFDQLLTASDYKEVHRPNMVKWSEAIRDNDPGYFCRLAVAEAVAKSEENDFAVWIVADCRRPSDIVFFDTILPAKSDRIPPTILKVRVAASDASRRARGWTFVDGVDNGATECALDAYDHWDFCIENDRSYTLDLNQLALFCALADSLSMANPFEEEPKSYVRPSNSSYSNFSASDSKQGIFDDLNCYEQQIESTLQESLESTGRSLRILQESEDIGINTATDLVEQGEKLRNVDTKLDEIHESTKQTQRHLNNVKSIFGGIKNYFSRDKDKGRKSSSQVPTAGMSRDKKLESTVDRLKSDSTVPYGDTYQNGYSSRSASGTLSETSKAAIAGTRWGEMDDEIENNLDLMGNSLQRLKELGLALGSEVDQQNQLLDRVANKAEKTNLIVEGQNKQMKKILGTKAEKIKIIPDRSSVPNPVRQLS